MAAMSQAAMNGQLPTEMMQHMPMPPPPPGMPGFPAGMPGIPPMQMPIPGIPMPSLPGALPGIHPPPMQHQQHSYRERSPHRNNRNEDDFTREMRQYSDTRSRIKRESGSGNLRLKFAKNIQKLSA